MTPTPLERAPKTLSAGRELFLKREDVHELGAFKWRGALPTLQAYRSRRASAVVTASTGNHGAATAWAAARLSLEAFVYVPRGASRSKLELIEGLGARILETGKDLDEAKEEAKRFAEERGLPFFEDGVEPAQYAGYGSIAEEILDQLGQAPGRIVVPVGNGALIGGIGESLANRGLDPERLLGVVASAAPVMALSFEAGHPVPSRRMATFADGLAVRIAIPRAVEVLCRVVGSIVSVSERQIAHAVGAYSRAGIRVEGAAAAALAAVPGLSQDPWKGPVVLVVTGRNIDEELWRRARDRPETFEE